MASVFCWPPRGAALIWAVNATVSGMNIHTIGVILLIVGVVGFATSLFFLVKLGEASAPGGRSRRARRAVKTPNLGGRAMVWLLVLLIVLLALGGGIFLSKLLFIVLIVALVVAVLARRSTV